MAGNESQDNLPACFGVLDAVFPIGPEGLREVAPDCWPCASRVECLRSAASSDYGVRALARERERPPAAPAEPEQTPAADDPAGKVGEFLRRWSRLKTQDRERG